MKYEILLLLLFAVFSGVFSDLDEMNNCWEQRNVSIAVDDLPTLYKRFTACLEKCHELKSNQRITVTSQLKTSVSVLRDLYYRGRIILSMVQKYSDLYAKAKKLCSAKSKLIPNWLTVKYENVPVSYDMDLMLTKDEKHVCNELIIVSKELGRYGVSQLIPLPTFDNDLNPRFLILPYKNNFIARIDDTHEDTILYKVYFESMKCMNIINTNPIKVHFLNKRFKRWIENTVIPVSKSIPDTVPGFGAIYRILQLAEAVENSIETNYGFCNKPSLLNDEIIDGYPIMTLGLMKNEYGRNSVQILGIVKNIHLMELILITLVICIIVILFILIYVFDKKWKNIYNLIPAFQLDLNNVSHDAMKKILSKEKIIQDNDCLKEIRVSDNKLESNDTPRDTCDDVTTMNSESNRTSSKRHFPFIGPTKQNTI